MVARDNYLFISFLQADLTTTNLKSTKRSVFVSKVDCRTRLPVEIQLTTFCNYSMLLWDNRRSLVASFLSAAFINVSIYNNISLLSIFYLLFYIV